MSATPEEVVMSATPEEVVVSATPEEVVVSATPEEVVEKKMITLKSSDEVVFEVEEAVALKSQTIKHMIEDGVADNGIPLANVDGEILSKVLDYCQKHAEAEALPKGGEDASTKEKELRNWDKEFVNVDLAMNFELILAANYLDIKSLLDLVSQTVADHIKDKSVEEVRAIFNIKNDFTPEEEAEVRKENQWAFD